MSNIYKCLQRNFLILRLRDISFAHMLVLDLNLAQKTINYFSIILEIIQCIFDNDIFSKEHNFINLSREKPDSFASCVKCVHTYLVSNSTISFEKLVRLCMNSAMYENRNIFILDIY